MTEKKKVKVFVIDDSVMVRKVLSEIINSDPALEVIGTAANGKIALQKLQFTKPDVITLDIQMPEMDGIEVLQHIMSDHPTKVIMVSALTSEGAEATIKAMDMGAVDFIEKPQNHHDINSISDIICKKIRHIGKASSQEAFYEQAIVSKFSKIKEKAEAGQSTDNIVVIGSSTGGPSALKEIFHSSNICRNCGYLVVQHMPDTFTGLFAKSLNQVTPINFKEASDNEIIRTGCGYVAPGNAHIKLVRQNNKLKIKLDNSGKVSGHMPSVDVLFKSAAEILKDKIVAVIMTGMGKDGVEGMKLVKQYGGHTIAQDKESSIVFGMNKEAILANVVDQIVSLKDIPKTIRQYFK